MNRTKITAASLAEFTAKVLVVEAIGGSVVENSHTESVGAVTFQVLLTDQQLSILQQVRAVQGGEAAYAREHAIVSVLGGSITPGSLYVLNGRLKFKIDLPEAQRGIYRMMKGLSKG